MCLGSALIDLGDALINFIGKGPWVISASLRTRSRNFPRLEVLKRSASSSGADAILG